MAHKQYTEQFVLKEIKDLLNTLKKRKSIFHLGQLFENKEYSEFRYYERVSDPTKYEGTNDRASRYGHIEEIAEMSQSIKKILESRVIVGATIGKYNPTMSIFNLKNNYGYKDKTEVDNNLTINPFEQVLKDIQGQTNQN